MKSFPRARRAAVLALALLLPALAAPARARVDAPAAQALPLAERAFERGAAAPAWVERVTAIPAETAADALTIRLADLQFHVGDDTAYYVHKAVVAHEVSALGALGQVDIEFQPAYQRVQLHRLTLLRGGVAIDKLATADVRFLQRERGLEQGMYDGSVTAQIVTTDVRVGDTLDYEYTVSGQNPVFGGHVIEAAQWDYPAPVALRRVSIDMPAGRSVAHRLVGAANDADAPGRSVRQQGVRTLLRFEAAALPAVLGEAFVPSDVHPFRWLQFSDFRDWADVNAWALELFSAPTAAGVLDGPLRAARAAATPEQAVASVLAFVQNEIRYLSLSMGENSHRPFPPAQVLERRYGDCKDKTLLAVTMLRALGIDAAPVLVASQMTSGVDRLLPSPLLFDHAIVRVVVNGKTYFLDPTRTGQAGALETMGQTHGGRQVLVVARGSTALTTIPQPAGAALLSRRVERITLAAMDQPADFEERLEVTGAAAEHLRAQLARMSKQELHKAYEGALVKRYPEARLVGDPVVEDDRDHNTVAIAVRHRVPNLFAPSANGDSWSMNYTPSNLAELFAPPGNARRSFPLALPLFPDAREYDLTVTLPAAFAMTPGQARRSVDDAAFTLTRTLDIGARSLHIKLLLAARADRVLPAQLPAYLKDIQQYNEMMGGALRVYKADMAGAAAAKAPPRPTEQARLEQLVQGSTRVIAEADAFGRDAAAPLCERARAYAWLGRKADAQKDAARAVQLQPQGDEALRCRAEVSFVLGRFKEAEADFGKLIARGADQADTYLGRGLASLYLNNLAAAQADFRLAASKADGDAERARAAVLARVAGARDAPAPAASDDAALAWLVDAAAMLAGREEPEHMLSRASRNLPAGSDGRLVEAYYYAGRYYRDKGDAVLARAFFQRAVDKRMLTNPYHVAAMHELAR